MPTLEPFWNIRFAATARALFSTIPRGEADSFAQAVEVLRRGPQPPGFEQIDDKLYQYSANGYRIAFEVVADAQNTVRVTVFEREVQSH
ncbi:MAG: hypothetical protein M3Q45_10940 [Chloroflexota bacterium]|nr:hypothetical protein [Chloroflexota bacterium]